MNKVWIICMSSQVIVNVSLQNTNKIFLISETWCSEESNPIAVHLISSCWIGILLLGIPLAQYSRSVLLGLKKCVFSRTKDVTLEGKAKIFNIWWHCKIFYNFFLSTTDTILSPFQSLNERKFEHIWYIRTYILRFI